MTLELTKIWRKLEGDLKMENNKSEKLEKITLEDAEEMVKGGKANFMSFGYDRKAILVINKKNYLFNERLKKYCSLNSF